MKTRIAAQASSWDFSVPDEASWTCGRMAGVTCGTRSCSSTSVARTAGSDMKRRTIGASQRKCESASSPMPWWWAM